jgi:hypothetical protein
MLQSYIILNAPFTPAASRIAASNKKQFFMSWYVVWERYVHAFSYCLCGITVTVFISRQFCAQYNCDCLHLKISSLVNVI